MPHSGVQSINNDAMNAYVSLGLLLLGAAVPIYMVSRQGNSLRPHERQEDLPSLHSVVSSMPRQTHSDFTEDTQPAVSGQHPAGSRR